MGKVCKMIDLFVNWSLKLSDLEARCTCMLNRNHYGITVQKCEYYCLYPRAWQRQEYY